MKGLIILLASVLAIFAIKNLQNRESEVKINKDIKMCSCPLCNPNLQIEKVSTFKLSSI